MSQSFAVKTSNGAVIAHSCVRAHSFVSRLVGLLNHSQLSDGEALLIDPCTQVHSFFMRFSIDVIFLDRQNIVVAHRELRPWRMTAMHFKATKVLECALGTCRTHNIKKGDQLELPL